MSGRAVLAFGFLAALVACLTPVANMDVYFHLSAARWMHAHGAVPTADFLSWTHRGRPWVDFEWATQLLYAVLARCGGMTALWAFKAAAFAALLLAFAALLRLWRLPDAWIGLALPPFILSFGQLLDARPEIASYAFCLLELYALEARRMGKLKLGLAPLAALHAAAYAAWANLHAGYPLGLALCLLYAAGEAVDGRGVRDWLIVGAAALAGSFATPYGLTIVGVFADHWRRMDVLRAYALQWRPPALGDPYARMYWLLFFSSSGALLACAATSRRLPYAHWFVVLAVSALAARSLRHTAYYALLCFPLALRALSLLEPPRWWKDARAYALAFGVVAVAASGRQTLGRQHLFERLDQTSRRVPAGACAYLKTNAPRLAGLKLYNSWNLGGYLGYALYPGYAVFADGRYVFDDELPQIARALSSPESWKAFVIEKDIGLVVQENTGAAIDLAYMPPADWDRAYEDERAVVWVRRGAAR